MKIILVRTEGNTQQLSLSRRRALAGVLAVAVLAISVAFGGIHMLTADQVDEQVVAQWRAQLEQQDDMVREVELKALAQSSAVGRQLADMRARLLRMEALGTHLTQAADLTEEEFNFAAAPAQGGPVASREKHIAWVDLQTQLDELSGQLRQREKELAMLDSVLANQDLHDQAQVPGRPVVWGWLSSPYGERVDPFSGKIGWHAGVDFAGREGSEVIAVASGVVTYAGKRSGYGQLVEIAHANGLVTRYAHHANILVSTGDIVKKGDPIGKMGSTGRSTGPHVHFEVLKDGRQIDPAAFVRS